MDVGRIEAIEERFPRLVRRRERRRLKAQYEVDTFDLERKGGGDNVGCWVRVLEDADNGEGAAGDGEERGKEVRGGRGVLRESPDRRCARGEEEGELTWVLTSLLSCSRPLTVISE